MSFDGLAAHYDWMETLTAGNRLQRVRTTWLEELRGCRRILSVGEGHGRFAEACATRFPEAELTCVETSPRMLQRAQIRTRNSPAKFHWHCTDFMSWAPVEKYDAIVTCFFLDCFPPEQLKLVIAKLATAAAPGAIWLVADFALPAQGIARLRAQAIHSFMYAFFRLVTALPASHLSAPDEFLLAHGLRLRSRREFEWGLLRADLWQ